MGFLKGCLKVLGTTALTVTGAASSVFKGVSDTMGVELGSEIFGAVKDASINGIRSMWTDDEASEKVEEGIARSYDLEDSGRRSAAQTAYKMAQVAKEKGDMEKYEKYMEKYYEYK